MIKKPARVAIYILLGVLCLTACESIAISKDRADATSEINGPVKDEKPSINIGDNDND